MAITDFFDHLIHEFELPLRNPVLVFSLILLIILLSPILLKRLNIPGIIGLIIAGVIIGPHGFKILEKNSAIELFSTIGLLYIMFIAGLEIDMNEFRINRNKSLLFGFFTFIIPLSIGFPVCYYGLEYDFNASLLTASMFSTHTLVAYPIVSKLGISKNKAVATAVGGTILTDTAVLIILAIIMRNQQGDLNAHFWVKLSVSLAILTAIMFLLIPRIARWFFRKLESEKHSHYIFVLSIVFFAAFLSEVAGVEPIIGAFMAGLALNKLIPPSSALMNRIEFIGNALFIPFFLISVGMVVDVKVLLKGPTALMIAATLIIVALLGKWLAAYFTQLVFRFSVLQRQLIFGLSSAHAAATLAIILVGYNTGILDENILNGTILLILITCTVASFVTEKAAKKMIIESDKHPENSSSTNPYYHEHILLPIANELNMEKLLEFAILIKDKKSANPISLLSVVSNDKEAETNIIRTRKKLQTFVQQASASETQVNVITTIDHNAASGIARISREIMANIIILGWPHKAGLIDKLIGEKIDQILNNSDKTIFICYLPRPLISHQRIVIAMPPLTEFEKGFGLWLKKISLLAKELSIPLLFCCNEHTEKAIKNYYIQTKSAIPFTIKKFSEWEDFLVLARDIKSEDLLVLASARRGATSYMKTLDNLPAKIEKHFEENSRLIIYPHQYAELSYEFSTEPLHTGLEAMQQIGKSISAIFRKKDPEK